MKQSDLVAEIESVVQEKCIAEKRPIRKDWVKLEIIGRHPGVEGADVEFALLCIYEHVEDTVEQVTRRYRPKPELSGDPQLTFADYPSVQKVYMIVREGESTLVPTDQCTPSELREKAKELRHMGAGCYAHAEELDRLADEREAEGR